MEAQPSYLALVENGELSRRAEQLRSRLTCCEICPRSCQVSRLEGELGSCCIGEQAWISSYGPHLGEEKPLKGWRGSGTIFFSGCNLHCIYCQNAEISQKRTGKPVSTEQLAEIMLQVQEMGCHNLNLVSPTHVVPQIVAALDLAARRGLRLPLVYNTGGYDALPTLKLLEDVVDIYMPDMKYASSELGLRYSDVEDYPFFNQQAVLEMHRQVGDLQIAPDGTAVRGVLIRHLVLPGVQAGSREILEFIASRISKQTYLNIMDQYRPAYLARGHPVLNRRISSQEYQQVLEWAREAGLDRLDQW